jgi:hypothetical protein
MDIHENPSRHRLRQRTLRGEKVAEERGSPRSKELQGVKSSAERQARGRENYQKKKATRRKQLLGEKGFQPQEAHEDKKKSGQLFRWVNAIIGGKFRAESIAVLPSTMRLAEVDKASMRPVQKNAFLFHLSLISKHRCENGLPSTRYCSR